MLEIDDVEDVLVCADCGTPLEGQEDRAYYFGENGALCWRCALRRGGVFDAEQERWVERPKISDLLDKAFD